MVHKGFRAFGFSLLLLGSSALTGVAHAELPEAARKILDTALASGDAATIQVVAGSIIKTYPDDEAEIRAYLAGAGNEGATGALSGIEASTASNEDVVPMVEIVEPPAPAPPLPTGFFGFDGWEGSVQLNASLNSGNTDEKAVGIAFNIERVGDQWRHFFNGAFDFTRTNGVTSKRRMRFGYEINYDFNERSYIFGSTEFVDDRFSGYDYRIIAAGGYGHRLIVEDNMLWELEGGPGFRYTAIRGSTETDSEVVGLFSSRFRWDLSDNAKLSNEIGVLYGSTTTTIDTLTALTMAINSSLSARLSLETNTDTDPPAGTKKTDTQTKASLVYGF